MAPPRRPVSLLHATQWCVAVGLVAVAVIRLTKPDFSPILIGLQGVGLWLLLPAFPLAALALWGRRRWLFLVSAALGTVQVVLTAGAVAWHGPQPLDPDDVRLRLVTANVLYSNPDIGQLADDIAAEGADVVLLQEVTPQVLQELRSSSLWAAYPYRLSAPQETFHGAATFSKLPITRRATVDVQGAPMLVTDLQTGAGTVRFVNVHTTAPLTSADIEAWAAQFPGLARLMSSSPHPIVLGGDFNATLEHGPLDAVVGDGVRDAFDEAGRGLGATWPTWGGGIPPLMRLDHVLVDARISVQSVTRESSIGSDHARLVAVLGVPPQA